MITGIHQPNFLPWQGYFYKIAKADNFVFLDNVDILTGSSKAITNRVKIKTSSGAQWLTVPIKKGDSKLICDIQMDNSKNWKEKHLKTIITNYSMSPHFKEVFDLVQKIYNYDTEFLSKFNINAIKELCNYIGVESNFVVASELSCNTKDRNLRLISICEELNSTSYLSGKGGVKYHDIELFKSHNISIETTNFNEQEYQQQFQGFEPGLSLLDVLFNKGNVSIK